jgi:hypothetical protein
MEMPDGNRTGEMQMNQTIHAHQIIHAFAQRDDVNDARKPPRGHGAIQERRDEIRRRLADARRIATAAVLFLTLIATEFLIGDAASGGWFGDVLNQTSQLLALGSPF